MKALSIRQPWAWLIVNGHKDVENRSRRTHLRGRIQVHASLGMTRDEYAAAYAIADEEGVELPPFDKLLRGGIMGQVDIIDCLAIAVCDSPWAFGPFCYVLSNPKPLPFQPCKGSLGFFTPDFLEP